MNETEKVTLFIVLMDFKVLLGFSDVPVGDVDAYLSNCISAGTFTNSPSDYKLTDNSSTT